MAGFRGGFGGGNMAGLMKQAQAMQAQMQKAKEQIAATDFEGSAGGGMVKIVLTGERKIKSVKLDPQIIDPDDVEMIEDLVTAAFNEAGEKLEKMEKEMLPNIPGM